MAELLIIHCPEKHMAKRLITILDSDYSNQDLLEGWNRYGEELCYVGVGRIEFYCSIKDKYLVDKEVILFEKWVSDL